MINPTTHAIVEFALPTAGTEPIGITAGADGNLWFTEAAGNQIGIDQPDHPRASPSSRSRPRIPTLTRIAAGPDGNLWFVETYGEKVSVLTPTENHVATANPPASITTNAAFGMTVTVSFTVRRG